MTYNEEAAAHIEAVMKDPAGFLVDQFNEGGALYYPAFEFFSLNHCPMIMRLESRLAPRLTVTAWDPYYAYFDKIEYQAILARSSADSPLEWALDQAKQDGLRTLTLTDAGRNRAATDYATCRWKWIVTDPEPDKECLKAAWFFPVGPYAARNHPGLVLSIGDLDLKEWK